MNWICSRLLGCDDQAVSLFFFLVDLMRGMERVTCILFSTQLFQKAVFSPVAPLGAYFPPLRAPFIVSTVFYLGLVSEVLPLIFFLGEALFSG